MNSEEPIWVYVGNGQLRLWNGREWTESYRPADRPRPQQAAVPYTLVEPDARAGLGPSAETRGVSRIVTAALLLAAALVATAVGLTYLRG